jgi:hypothetical protein
MKSLAKYSNSVMTLLFLAIFVMMVALSSGYPAGARFMPFVVGLPAIALCLLQLALDARERRLSQEATDDDVSDFEKAQQQASRAVGRPVHFDVGAMLLPEKTLEPREKIRRELVAWAYVLGLIGMILLFGFYIAVPLFLFTFLKFQAKAHWLAALGLTAAAGAVLYVAFEEVLRVSLHPGFLTEPVRALLTG